MAKDINSFPNTVVIPETFISSSSTTSIDVVNVDSDAVTISNIELAVGERFSITHDTLPKVVNPYVLTYEGNIGCGGNVIADMIVLNGYMFIAYSNGTIASRSINPDGTLGAVISSVVHGGFIRSIDGYGKILFSARDAAGITSYLIADDGTFVEVDTILSLVNVAMDVYANEDFVFLADDGGELSAYSYNLSGDLALRSFISVTGNPVSVFGDDNFIYLGLGTGVVPGIESYTFDGSTFTLIDKYVTANSVGDMCMSDDGELLFAACRTQGLVSLSLDTSGNFYLEDSTDFGGSADSFSVIFENGYVYVGNEAAVHNMAIVGIRNDNTLNFLYAEDKTGAINSTVYINGDYIYAPEGTTGIELFSKGTAHKSTINITFSPVTDDTVTDYLNVASDAVGSPDVFTLQGSGIGNSTNGIGSYNYYTHAIGRIAEQYKE